MAKNGNIHPTRIFKHPEELLKVFEEYVVWIEEVESKKWQKIQYVGKDGTQKKDAYIVPLSFDSFSVYCYSRYGVVKQYFENPLGYFDDFIEVCSHIKERIRANQVTGGLLGVFNPSITQRLNNIVEETKTVIVEKIEIDFTD